VSADSSAAFSVDQAPPEYPRVNPWLIAMTVMLATFMEVLDTSIANVALPHIAGSLSASVDESTWVLTSYLIANAIILPLSGWLTELFGRKRFYMTCVVIFTASSLLCGIAPSLPLLVLFRIMQGLGGGGLQPSAQAILADTFPPRQRGMAFSIYGMAVVFAPAIGPTLGGWITDNYSWRWLFYINVPVGILSLMLVSRLIHNPPALAGKPLTRGNLLSMDWMGMGLLTLGLGSLEFVLDKGQEDDWFGSSRIQFLIVLAVICLVAVVIRELVIKNPVVNLKLYRDRNFSLANVLIFCLGFVLAGSTVLLPQFLQTLLGYSATRAGMVLSPAGVVLIFAMPMAGFLLGRVGARPMIVFGFIVLGSSLWLTSRLQLQTDYATFTIFRMMASVGLAALFTPISTTCFSRIPPGMNNAASSLYNLNRNLGSSFGIAAVTTVLARRAQFHQLRLAEHLTAGHIRVQQTQLGQYLAQHGDGLALPAARAARLLYRSVLQQAGAMAYLDAFWLLGALCFVMPVFALFIVKVQHAPAPRMQAE
jgi:MFS transporter, DHA2 family, multidrug resistance protein